MIAPETTEVREVLSDTEEKFDSYRRRIGLFVGPLAFVAVLNFPIQGLNYQAHLLASILAWISIWWITEPIPIPVTTLLGTVLCIITGIGDAKKVFSSYADPIILLFLGSFMLANAMAIHGLDKRFAYKILSLKGVGNHSGRLLFTFGAITAFLSMWISNTATAAMMFPIALGIIAAYHKTLSESKDKPVTSSKFATGLMLMTAYASSVGGIGTPVGTPPNIIGMGMLSNLAHIKISFFQWMSFAVPILIVMYSLLFGIMYFFYKPELKELKGSLFSVNLSDTKLNKLSRGEVNCLIAFFTAVTLWVTPGIISIIYTTGSPTYKTYNTLFPESVAALIAVFLLFLLPINWKKKEFTLTWKQAVKIDWGTLILFGGGLALGNLMFETKLADYLGTSLLNISGVNSMWGITFITIYIAIIVTETTSNTASANMIVPLAISICMSSHINPIPAAIGASIGSSWGFMLPVSTASNSIVYGSGLIPITKMIRAGFWFSLSGGLIIWLGLRVLLPLFGLA